MNPYGDVRADYFTVESERHLDKINVAFGYTDGDWAYQAQPWFPIYTSFPKGSYFERQPCFALGRGPAQMLMDELWKAGIRPTDFSGENTSFLTAALAAKDANLNDLRLILERFLPPKPHNDQPAPGPDGRTW